MRLLLKIKLRAEGEKQLGEIIGRRKIKNKSKPSAVQRANSKGSGVCNTRLCGHKFMIPAFTGGDPWQE